MARSQKRRHPGKPPRNHRKDRAGEALLHRLHVMLASLMGPIVRSHWAIENSLHWVMIMVFRDDECTMRTDNAPASAGCMDTKVPNLGKSISTSQGWIAKRNTDPRTPQCPTPCSRATADRLPRPTTRTKFASA